MGTHFSSPGNWMLIFPLVSSGLNHFFPVEISNHHYWLILRQMWYVMWMDQEDRKKNRKSKTHRDIWLEFSQIFKFNTKYELQKSQGLRVVCSKNFSRATFFVFWVTERSDNFERTFWSPRILLKNKWTNSS